MDSFVIIETIIDDEYIAIPICKTHFKAISIVQTCFILLDFHLISMYLLTLISRNG